MIVGADGLHIDLNGRTITGSGTGAGIMVSGRADVSIFGGTLKNFDAGVRVMNSTNIVVRDSALVGNTDGIDFQAGSHANTIRRNVLRDNRSRGIMLRGGTLKNVVHDNTFLGNRVGVLLFGAVETAVIDNLVSSHVLAGIRFNVLASGNTVRGNNVVSNPTGIEFIVTPTGSSLGNSVVGNTIATNDCGLKGPVEGNTVRLNTFNGNVADSCQ